MGRLNLLLALSIVFLLTSCEEKVACHEDILKTISDLETQFQTLHLEDVSHSQIDQFKTSVQKLTTVPGDLASCTDQTGKIVEFKKEATRILSLINVSNSASAKKKNLITPEVVYGKDNRVDLQFVSNPLHRDLAQSVAAHISKDKISADGSLSSSTIGSSMGLCKSERFVEQINPARCSGFLVAEDLLVTAGHCVTGPSDCERYAWVFDFSDDTKKVDKDKSVFNCKEIVSRELSSSTKMDYALIRLDRKVTDRKALKFRTKGEISDNAPLVVIGHPSGLPVKVADGANVRSVDNDVFFVANLDTFGGNSGSPVFDSATGIVEGILVRGENDYITVTENGVSCRKVFTCADDECRGEDVTRITHVKDLPQRDIPSEEEVSIALVSGQNTEDQSSFMQMNTYSHDNLSVSGQRVFNKCVYHIFKSATAKEWIDAIEGPCDLESTLATIVASFLSEI